MAALRVAILVCRQRLVALPLSTQRPDQDGVILAPCKALLHQEEG